MSSRSKEHVTPLQLLAVAAALLAGWGFYWYSKEYGFTGANADPERPNVVVIVFDTLRADHVGTYGYKRDTTPFIDSLASEGLVFEQAYAPSSYTRQSVSSYFTGVLPSHGGHIGQAAAPNHLRMTLAEALKKRGYLTALFCENAAIRDSTFARGFDTFTNHSPKRRRDGKDYPLNAEAEAFIREARISGEPFFLYMHYMDPHDPYDPPLEFAKKFGVNDVTKTMVTDAPFLTEMDKHLADGFGPGHAYYEEMLARYDAEILHMDGVAEELYKNLDSRGLLDNTIIIFMSDHGEEFAEHDWMRHAWTVYEESVRVPLFVNRPGHIEAGHVATPVSLVDLFPTLANLTGFRLPTYPIDGIPLPLNPEAQSQAEAAPPRPLFGELVYSEEAATRSVRLGDWKYYASTIDWPDPAVRSKRLADRSLAPPIIRGDIVWLEPVYEALFNLTDDPTEQHDLIDSAPPEVLAEMRGALKEYQERCETSGVSPEESEMDFETRERLKALGYL